jgi:DNA-binding NarL/FixJ family response regulator
MINVFLVDDEQLVREALRLLIKDIPGIKVVGEAATGEAALAAIREKKPHVILLDINLPDVSGLHISRKLLQQQPQIKIIILTAAPNDIFSHRLLEAGVHGYFTKDTSRDELMNAIKSVYGGERIIGQKIANELAIAHTTKKTQSIFDELSNREMEVMLMMLRGMPTQTIAEKLFLSPKTVSTYRIHIFDKLKVKNDVELILLAIRHGLVDMPLKEGKPVE